MSITPDELRRVPLLRDLGDKELARLAGDVSERTIPAGRPIMTEGSGGIGFFMILEGRATVNVGDTVRATLGVGDHVGELALLDGDAPRTASVVAETDVRCAGMTAWQFRPFVKDHPTVAWGLLQTLAERLREANRRGSDVPSGTAQA
jgi:CRP/FNR family transcriptional regulator